MPNIQFGSLKAANKFRDSASQYVSSRDDRRSTTVRLKRSAPDRLVERAREKAMQTRQERTRKGAGKANLSKKEKKTLKRSTNFTWQEHGFEAMSVKAAMQAKGVTEWQDYYEPGEGVESALSKLREAKGGAGSASIGVGGKRTDTEEMGNRQRRARQSERADAQALESAKDPAIVERDPEAIDFLETETMLGEDIFDVSLSGESATGKDVDRVRERNQQRTQKARHVDDMRAAPVTHNPLVWSQDPTHYDFPGVDTPEAETIHESRSPHAQAVDERERAPMAEDVYEWMQAPDQLDLEGVDTPSAAGWDSGKTETNPMMKDDRDRQDKLDFAADATQHRESRKEVEQNMGGMLEDTRSSPDRGGLSEVDAGVQDSLTDMDKELNETFDDIE